MKDLLVLLAHLLTTIAKLLCPGGARAIVAIGFGVHAGDMNGVALCRMFNAAISSQGAPRYLSSDNDPLFLYHQWQANLRILGTDEVKTVPYAPLSHPFVERLIGTIRREFLEQTLFLNTSDLERKLVDFRQYYNSHRIHTALDDNTPVEMPGKTISCYAELSQFQWKSHIVVAFIICPLLRK